MFNSLVHFVSVLRFNVFFLQDTFFGKENFINVDGNNNAESFLDDIWSFAQVGANADVLLEENLDTQPQESKEKPTENDAVSYVFVFT